MSRYSDDGDWDEPYPNAGYLVAKTQELALRGRKGRQALIELRDHLLAMPVKGIAHGALVGPSGAPCAVGALVIARRTAMGEDASVVIDDLRSLASCVHCVHPAHGTDEAVCGAPKDAWDHMGADTFAHNRWWPAPSPGSCGCTTYEPDSYEAREQTIEAGKAVGLSGALAIALSYENDEGLSSAADDRRRYDDLLRWIDRQLALPQLTRWPAKKARRAHPAGAPAGERAAGRSTPPPGQAPLW